MKYTQCEIQKKFPGGKTSVQIAFIPSKFAKLGNKIKIRSDYGEWLDGYEVTQVYTTPCETEVFDAKQSIIKYKKNTVDSLPKCPNK